MLLAHKNVGILKKPTWPLISVLIECSVKASWSTGSCIWYKRVVAPAGTTYFPWVGVAIASFFQLVWSIQCTQVGGLQYFIHLFDNMHSRNELPANWAYGSISPISPYLYILCHLPITHTAQSAACHTFPGSPSWQKKYIYFLLGHRGECGYIPHRYFQVYKTIHIRHDQRTIASVHNANKLCLTGYRKNYNLGNKLHGQ